MGGTLPAASILADVLGLDTVFFSFSSGDENLHAPNEFFRLARLREGLQAWAHLLVLLASSQPAAQPFPGRERRKIERR